MPSPTVDQSATGTATNAAVHLTLATSANNARVVIASYCETGSAAPAISGVAGGGLTFTRLARANASFNTQGSIEVWSALAATALAATTFTITYAAAYDDAAAVGFGVLGANTAASFDPNASLPALYSGSNAAPSFAGISTSNPDDLLVMVVGSNNNNTLATPPTGWTALAHALNTGGTAFGCIGAGYLSTAAKQTSQTYTWGQSISGNGVEGILFALTGDATGGRTPTIRRLQQRQEY